MSETERIARAAFEELPARDKRLVLSWRELGNDWVTSMVNSGVLRTGRRVGPYEAQEDDPFEEILLTQQQERVWSSDTRRQACEHDAAHVAVCKALGLTVTFAYAEPDPDGFGGCLHRVGTDFETATIAMAGEQWIGIFRSQIFLGGPSGCDLDRRTALEALPDHWERRRAHRLCGEILYDKQDLVLRIANQIDRDGRYLP